MRNKLRKKPLIYFGDLTYDTTIISNELFPISIGYIIAYLQKMMPDQFIIKHFKFPDELFDAIDEEVPDILGLSHYPWNVNLTLMAANYYTIRNASGIIVFGGSTVPCNIKRQHDFFNNNPNIDILVMYDGEFGFYEISKRYIESGFNKDRMLNGDPIKGCAYYVKGEERVAFGETIDRPENFDEIPSPFLTGVLDKYFDNMLLNPMIQTTRGCPFLCAYCWAGNKYHSQIRHFSLDRVMAELEYIIERRKSSINRRFHICDTNFGMFLKDEKIADKIAWYQENYNYPTTFSAPCAKNNKEIGIRISKKIKNTLVSVSIQSTNTKIQHNVNRQAIDFEEYKQIVAKFQELNIPVSTEIITGLPGETKETHLQTIKDVINLGINEIEAFTLMLLEGIELSSDLSQEKNKWDKRYRILPRNYGKYRDKVCFEIETIAVGSNTYTFEDYLYLRGFHGALRVVFNSNFFVEFTSYMRQYRIDLFEFSMKFYENLQIDSGPAGEQFCTFLKETRDEIWDSKEEIYEHLRSEINYNKLLTGEYGENLLGKYKFKTICENFEPMCDFYYKQVVGVMKENKLFSQQAKLEIEDLKASILAKAGNIFSEQNMKGEPLFVALWHDVPKWAKDGFAQPISDYKFSKQTKLKYVIRDSSKQMVKEILMLFKDKKIAFWRAISTRYFASAACREGSVIDSQHGLLVS